MKIPVAPLLLVTSLLGTVGLLGTGCGIIPSKYELDISSTGNVESLQSLYIIVSPREHVQEALTSKASYGKLLDEEQMRRYTSFVQYEPFGTSWKLVFQGQQNDWVEYEVDDDVIKIDIDSDLIEKAGMSEYCVVVLGFFGNDGFEQVTVNHTSLADNADQVVEVSGKTLNLHDA